MKIDLIIKNIGKLVTMENSFFPRIGNQMNELTILENAYIAVAQGKIFQVGIATGFVTGFILKKQKVSISILFIAILIVILNLGTPIDYQLILGAGLFTFIYIAMWKIMIYV